MKLKIYINTLKILILFNIKMVNKIQIYSSISKYFFYTN